MNSYNSKKLVILKPHILDTPDLVTSETANGRESKAQTAADASDRQIRSKAIQVFQDRCITGARLFETSVSIYLRRSTYQLSEETT